MIPASALLKEAVKYSHTQQVVVDVYRKGVLAFPPVPVIAGKITADRGQKARLSADVTLVLNSWEATQVDPRVCRFQVRRGVASMGVADLTPIGQFRVDDVDRSVTGEIALSGSGLESYVVDARFLAPRTPPYGSDTVGTIRQLITEALPEATVRALNTRNRIVTATAPWEKERWDAIESLADSILAEVYVNHLGEFIIADLPQITTGAQVATFDEGDGGLLVDRSEKETRDQVYNAVSVSGSSTDPNVPPVWAWAADMTPTSDTFFYGPFGQVPRFFSSQFFTTTQQCLDYAVELLAQSLAANNSLSFTGLPLDYLEVGDLVGVRRQDSTMATHLLQKTQSNLGTSGGLVCDTLSSKVIARDDI